MSSPTPDPTAAARAARSARTLARARAVLTPPDAGDATRVSLVALLMVLTVELVRASGPLLDRAFTTGVVTVAVTALGTYAAAGLVAAGVLLVVGRRSRGARDGRAVQVATVLFAVLRLVAQGVTGEARTAVGLVTIAVAVAVLTLAVAFVAGRPTGGRQAALGLVLGTGLATGLQLVLGTWDAFWRAGALGWVVTGVLVIAAVLAAHYTSAGVSTGRPRRLWALGPYLAIVTMVLANPAFAASQSGAELRVAGLALVVGHLLAVWALLNPAVLTGPVRIAAAVAVPVTVLGVFRLEGSVVLLVVVLLEVATGIAVASAFSTRRVAAPGVAGTAVAAGVVGLGLIVPLLVYLVDYDMPLPVDNALVLVLAGLAVMIAGLRRRTPVPPGVDPGRNAPVADARQPFRSNAVRLLALPATVLAVVGWWVTAPAAPAPTRAASDDLVLLDWNLHYGVAPGGTAVDLEGIARTIEAQDPDVVALQEVARGWVLGGGADMATWLSHRLDMPFVWAPAADPQFGNVLLARSELTDVVRTELPFGAGPQHRSAVSADVTVPDGSEARVTSVHLQHRETGEETRLTQLDFLLAALVGTDPAVLAGDLNATPGSKELALLTRSGWSSLVDGTQDPDAPPTFPSTDPVERIDWVLGREVDASDGRVLAGIRYSDHLPIVVRLSPRS